MHRRKEIDFKDSLGLWYIETKLPITNRVLEIYIPFAVIQEDITLVKKIGTCSRYHSNAMSKITANGWYLGPRLTCKSCKCPIEDMRACLVCTKYTVYSKQYTKTELKYHSYRGLAYSLKHYLKLKNITKTRNKSSNCLEQN